MLSSHQALVAGLKFGHYGGAQSHILKHFSCGQVLKLAQLQELVVIGEGLLIVHELFIGATTTVVG